MLPGQRWFDMDQHYVSVGATFSHRLKAKASVSHDPHHSIDFNPCWSYLWWKSPWKASHLKHILYPQCTSLFPCVCVCVRACVCACVCSDLVQVGQRETVMLKAFTSICCMACTNTHIYTQTHHRDGRSASKACPLSFKRYTLWPQKHSALGFLHCICLPAPGAKAGGWGRGLGLR